MDLNLKDIGFVQPSRSKPKTKSKSIESILKSKDSSKEVKKGEAHKSFIFKVDQSVTIKSTYLSKNQ